MLNDDTVMLLVNTRKSKNVAAVSQGDDTIYKVIMNHVDQVFKCRELDRLAYALFLKDFLTQGLDMFLHINNNYPTEFKKDT